jgi:glycosyltransferase involved in cell wall biosynthesis
VSGSRENYTNNGHWISARAGGLRAFVAATLVAGTDFGKALMSWQRGFVIRPRLWHTLRHCALGAFSLRMRIALLSQSYPPMISGAALAAQQLAAGLSARGHAVMVIAASHDGRASVHRDARLHVVRLASRRNPFRAAQRVMLWPRPALARELRAFRPDLLHLHDYSSAGLAGLRAAQMLNLPAALTLHLLPASVSAYTPPVPGLRRMVEAGLWAYCEWLGRQCRAVAAPSRASADIIRERIRTQPAILPNGVDLTKFTPQASSPGEASTLRAKYGLHPDLPVILHVGRVDVEKRVDVIVRMAAMVMRRVPAQLLLVGDGTQRARLIRLSERLRIREHCCFTGFVPADGDLPALYRLASVFVIASEVETQGLAGLEAAASGAPLVAVRAASLPELVEDGVNGYLVEPGDTTAMAERVSALLQNPERARAMGGAASVTAEKYSLDETVAAHERFYESIFNVH